MGILFQRISVLALSMIMVATSLNFATAQTEEDEDADRSTTIEEITVTSRKREESMQTVPISVTAFTASDLEEMNVTDPSGIADFTPNLMVNRTASGSSAYVTCMRGLCRTDTTLTDDPYVGMYLNGVYTGKAVGSVFEVADIERIEILRGPQGTIFGKNTIGGAVNMITKKPSGEAGASLKFIGGNYNTLNFKAVVDLPEFLGIKTKFSLLSKQRDPFTKNNFVRADGKKVKSLEDEDKKAALLDMLWEPTDNFAADLTVDWTQVRELPWTNFATQATGSAFGWAPNAITDERKFSTNSYEEGEGAKNETDIWGVGLTLDWDLGSAAGMDDMILRSITAYRSVENQFNANASGLAFRNLWTQDDFETQNLSQEFQWLGTTLDNKLDFLVGLFFLREEGEYTNNQGFFATPPAVGLANTFYNTEIDYKSYAFFTEETFHFTDQLALSAGIRFTKEDREASHGVIDVNSVTGPDFDNAWSTKGDTFKSDTWSPRITLTYDVVDGTMLFGGWSRGFKSGGFNARSGTEDLWGPYDDQQVDSFELGVKSNFWDGRAMLNVTGFYQDIKDAQVQFNRINPVTFAWEVLLDNAGDATIYGMEIESVVRPVEGLELIGGFGWTESEYDTLINPWSGADEADQSHFEFSPTYNWNLTGRYVFPPMQVGNLSFRIDYTGSSKVGFNRSIAQDKIVGQDAYGLLGARLALTDVDFGIPGVFDFAAFGTNLTDESYRVGGYGVDLDNLGLGTWYTNVYGPPRMYGAEITYRWGSQQ